MRFVLLHGCYHGGWSWRKTGERLATLGFEVTRPTLTGLGERRHLVSPQCGLRLHVEDLVAHIEHEDIDEVVLVSHSYGGMVATAAAERLVKRIRGLIYVNAFVPRNGQNCFDQQAGLREKLEGFIAVGKTDWLVPQRDTRQLSIEDAELAAWATPRLSAIPIKTHADRIRFNEDVVYAIPAAFISCTGTPQFVPSAAEARRRGLPVFEFEAGHAAMLTEPERLADLLAEIARGLFAADAAFVRAKGASVNSAPHVGV